MAVEKKEGPPPTLLDWWLDISNDVRPGQDSFRLPLDDWKELRDELVAKYGQGAWIMSLKDDEPNFMLNGILFFIKGCEDERRERW